MKVKQGDGGRYMNMEKEYWKPMHQELVSQGKILGWYLYRIQFSGDGDEYNYVTVTHYQGSKNFNAFNQELVAKAHPNKKWEDISKETGRGRVLAASRLLQWHLQSFQEDQREPCKYAVLHYMKSTPGFGFFEQRRDYVKPAFDQAVQDGKMEGWGMWQMVFPSGADMPFNYVTADFYNDFDKIGNAGMGAYILKQNGEQKGNEIMQKMGENRRMAKNELWQLIDYVR